MVSPDGGPSPAQRALCRGAALALQHAARQLDAPAASPEARGDASRAGAALRVPRELGELLEELSRVEVSSPEWQELLAEAQLGPHAASLAAAALRRWVTDASPPPRTSAPLQTTAPAVLEPPPEGLAEVLACVTQCCSILQTLGRACESVCVPAAARLAQQLASPPVFASMAAAARVVKDRVPEWRPHAAAVSEREDPRAAAAALLHCCAAAVAAPLQLASAGEHAVAGGLSSTGGGPGAQRAGRGASRQRGVRRAQQQQQADTAGAASGTTQHVLEVLRDSGALWALSVALLAAPPAAVAPNAGAACAYAERLASAQWYAFTALQAVGALHAARPSGCALDLLTAPPVLQLRMEGLAQVSAAALEEQQQEQQRGEAATPGGGSSGGGEGSSPGWPLLRPDVLAALQGAGLGIGGVVDVCARLVDAAVGAVAPSGERQSGFAAPGMGVGPTAAAAAQRLFPTPARAVAAQLSRACSAMCSCCSRASADEDPAAPRALAATERLCYTGSALLRGAPPAEAGACMPHVLAAHAWHVRAAVSLHAHPPARIAAAVRQLTYALAGGAYPAPPGGRLEFADVMLGWERLSADVRAACVRALLPTRLMASLDAALRRCAGSGAEPSNDLAVAMGACAPVVPALLPSLMRERLLPAAADASAAAVEDTAGGGQWRPQDELGVVVTAAKLARREATRLEDVLRSGARTTPGASTYAVCLTELLGNTGSIDLCLPGLLLELDAARAQAEAEAAASGKGRGQGGSSSAGGSAQQRAAPLSAACHAVADAITLCTCSLLQLLTAALPVDVGRIWSRGARAVSGTNVRMSAERLCGTTQLAAACIARLRPPVLLAGASDPRRLLAEVARLLCLHEQREEAPDEAAAGALQQTEVTLCYAIRYLSADEDLLPAWAPGWLWAERPPQALSVPRGMHSYRLDRQNLAAPADATLPGPVMVVESAAAAAALGGRPWAEHAQWRREVAALARALIGGYWDEVLRVRGAIAAAHARAGAPPWPPRLLKLCANPSCSNFAGTREADLGLQRCSGCVCTYCSTACSSAHWQQHKAECRRLAAAAAAAAQREAGAVAPGPLEEAG